MQNQQKKIFVHLGAGAGDMDKRANFRCGFTEFIKKNCSDIDKAFVIEANPKNISQLKLSYNDYKNVEILNIAITNESSKELKFFYTEDDAPHYQVCSVDINHVRKHYPNSKIESFTINATNINEFIRKHTGNNINYLSIDLEGIDYCVLMKIDLNTTKIDNISIEHLHLSRMEKKNIVKHLNNHGFSYCGSGYDHNHYDFLFKKKKIIWNRLLSRLLWLINHKKVKYFNKLIFTKNI
tara:strand:+ start:432 stop:1145 length:714 start_codon:yes stop_codon:yes gene_type:complete